MRLELRTACFQLCGFEPQVNVASLLKSLAMLLHHHDHILVSSSNVKNTCNLQIIDLVSDSCTCLLVGRHTSISLSCTPPKRALDVPRLSASIHPPPQVYIREPSNYSLYYLIYRLCSSLHSILGALCMHFARLFAPTALAFPTVDVIAFRASRPLILSSQTRTTFRSMSKTTALGRGYEGNGEKGKKAPAIPRPSSRYVVWFVVPGSRFMLFDIGNCVVQYRNFPSITFVFHQSMTLRHHVPLPDFSDLSPRLSLLNRSEMSIK